MTSRSGPVPSTLPEFFAGDFSFFSSYFSFFFLFFLSQNNWLSYFRTWTINSLVIYGEGGGTGGGKSLSPRTFSANFSLLPKLDLKIGDGKHATPVLSRKGSYPTLRASPIHQHATKRGRNRGMSRIRRSLWRESPYAF